LALVKRKRGRPRDEAKDDFPLYDPDALAKPPLVGRDPSTKPADEKPLSAADAKKLLQQRAQELLDADAKSLPRLTKEIQRLRVVLQILNEADTGESDPQVHKELSLLNKLITGKGLDGLEGDDEAEKRERQQEAEKLLADRGVDPAQAGRFMRILQAVMGAGGTSGSGPDDADTEPGATTH
jgi:hypothetical protein